MADVRLVIKNKCIGLALKDGDLEGDDGLETAVIISLFTDRRVTDDDVDAAQPSKRGWWGDTYPDVDQDKIGSRLWLLERVKRTSDTLRRAEDYIREALDWLIEDGVADSITVSASYDVNNFLVASVEIQKPKGDKSRFQMNWDQQLLRAV